MKKKLIKIFFLFLFVFISVFVLVYYEQKDLEIACLLGCIVAGAVFAYWLLFAMLNYLEKEKAKKEKKNLINKNILLHNIEECLFENQINKILKEDSNESEESPLGDYIIASFLLGFVFSLVIKYQDFCEKEFWIRTVIVGAMVAGGIKLLLKNIKEKEIYQLKQITISIYYELKKLQNDCKNVQKIEVEQECEEQNEKELDELLYNVTLWAIDVHGVSTFAVKENFDISYSRAGKIVDQMFALGFCGPSKGNSTPREILISKEELEKLKPELLKR